MFNPSFDRPMEGRLEKVVEVSVGHIEQHLQDKKKIRKKVLKMQKQTCVNFF